MQQLRRNRVRNSGMGPERVAKTRTIHWLHHQAETADISNLASDGTAFARFPTGEYVYHFSSVSVTSKVAIVGETYPMGGVHIVQTPFISKYITDIALQIEGNPVIDSPTDTLLALNGYRGHDATDGALIVPFGGPDIFVDEAQEDAYALGTGNVKDLRLAFELSSAFDPATMAVKVFNEYSPVRRNIEWLQTQRTHRYDFSAAGQVEITDLPTHGDIAFILIEPDKEVKSAKLEVDNITLFEGTVFQLNSLLAANHGINLAALPANAIMLDFWRGREAQKGLRGLRHPDEQRRGANIRLTLDLMETNTEVFIRLGQCGPLTSQL